MTTFSRALPVSIGLLVVVASLAGCGREDITVYRVPKETPPAQMAGLPHNHPTVPTEPAKPRLQWQAPADWKELAPSQFRVASFQVSHGEDQQADVSVIPLSGTAGGDLQNVNRWREQVGQEPVTADQLPDLATPVTIAGEAADLYDLAGAGTGILAAIQHRDGTAWFYKMTGDPEVVAKEKSNFLGFLESFRFVHAAAPARPVPAPTSTAASGSQPQWQPPSAWEETDAGRFLVAKYLIRGADDTTAAVNISSSAGSGGGLAANVNRWCGQLGLAPLSATELADQTTPLQTAGGEAVMIALRGTDAKSGRPSQLIAAVVSRADQTWFYKLMGEPVIVTGEQASFIEFVRGVRY